MAPIAKRLRITPELREEIIAALKAEGLSLSELKQMLGMANDRAARAWLAREIKPLYPVISTGRSRGYLIATRPEHIDLAKRAAREAHRKAWSTHVSVRALDKWIIREEINQAGGSTFQQEIEELRNEKTR